MHEASDSGPVMPLAATEADACGPWRRERLAARMSGVLDYLAMSPASDEDLLARQSALQAEAREVLAGLDLAALAADVGPLLVTGSFVSGLMCWRELDVMVLAGPDFSPPDVMGLLARLVRRAGITGLEYRDERGPRCVTGQVRDERYHVTLTVERADGCWQIDLTLWLHDLHRNVTRWHEQLRERGSSAHGFAADCHGL
jgi:hypothetical protein